MPGGCPRLLKEYREVKSTKQDPEIQLELADESDIFKWKAYIQGPKDSPYSGGTFELSLQCADTYPLAPPKVLFVTPVFHPNVLYKTGEICLDILKPDSWTPAWTLQSVCRAVAALLSHPEADSPLCAAQIPNSSLDRSNQTASTLHLLTPICSLLSSATRATGCTVPQLTATATAATLSAMATCAATARWRKCTQLCTLCKHCRVNARCQLYLSSHMRSIFESCAGPADPAGIGPGRGTERPVACTEHWSRSRRVATRWPCPCRAVRCGAARCAVQCRAGTDNHQPPPTTTTTTTPTTDRPPTGTGGVDRDRDRDRDRDAGTEPASEWRVLAPSGV